MQRLQHESKRTDRYAGTLMIALGAGAILQSLRYPLGTLSRMGPGFYPLALGILLGLAGIGIILTAQPAATDGDPSAARPEWRGWICIALGIVAFIALGKHGGLVPATFAVVFISALGDRRNTLQSALYLALAMVAIAVVVFWWALKMQFPLFRWG